MSIASAIAARNGLLSTVGKNVMNIQFPKEFELYVIALELTDDNFNTLKYFVFPINPSSLEESKPNLTNIKKTFTGVSVLKTPTFVPTDINLNGSFGRGFKILLGSNYEDFIHSFQYQDINSASGFGTSVGSIAAGLKQTFDDRIKTGYGCIKILEEIISRSKGTGTKLIFHNPALGNSYLVTAGTLRMSQNEQTNMIWNYSLSLKSIAPLENLYGRLGDSKKVAEQLNITNYMQKRVDSLLNTLSRTIGDAL